MLLFWVQAHSDGKSDITIKTEWDRRQALITGVSLLFFICTAQRSNMGSVEISWERSPRWRCLFRFSRYFLGVTGASFLPFLLSAIIGVCLKIHPPSTLFFLADTTVCVGPPYIRIVISWHDIIISWHDIIISWHDIIISWHDTIISCCVWFETM